MSFFYHNTHDNVVFSGKLACEQCVYVCEKGQQCTRRTFIQPFCKKHLKALYNVEVKPSRIPNAGWGLFATSDINQGDEVCPCFSGEILSDIAVDLRYGDSKFALAPYAFEVEDDYIIDTALQRCAASYINDALGSGSSENACYSVHRPSKIVKIVATRPIQAGDEITVSYGPHYFRGEQHAHLHYSTTLRLRQII